MEYIEIGQIVNTNGLKGVVKVNPFTDDISKFEDLKYVYIQLKNELKKVKIPSGKLWSIKAIIDSIPNLYKLPFSFLDLLICLPIKLFKMYPRNIAIIKIKIARKILYSFFK